MRKIQKKMTRENAINNLEMISVAFVGPVTKEQKKLIDDTFDMAIKALKQESVLDEIRAEIKKEGEPCIYEIDFAYKHGLLRALEIIDKYRKGDEK